LVRGIAKAINASPCASGPVGVLCWVEEKLSCCWCVVTCWCAGHGNQINCPNLRYVPMQLTEWWKCLTGPRTMSCLSVTRVCDGHVDCQDTSDEQECGT